MTKADLEIKIEELESELKDLKHENNSYKKRSEMQSVWRYEVMSMLQNHSIKDCTDNFFCFRPLTKEEQEVIENDASYQAIKKDDCANRKFYKCTDSSYDIYGFIDEENYENITYGVTVFAAPPKSKEFKCVLGFGDIDTLIGARLALSILFIMMDCNECSITRMYSKTLTDCIKSNNRMEFIVGTFRSVDDKYHFAVTADENSDGSISYYTYYFKKKRSNYDQIGEDYDFSHLTRTLACLTSAAKECDGGLEFDDDLDDFDDFDGLFLDLDDRFS